MTKLTYQQRCFQWASNQFLYEEIPDEYFEKSEEEQHKHLEYYAWEAVEHYDGYKLSNIIDNLAEHIIQEVYPKKENTSLTNDERYEFIKLYDILRDMDFELTEKQVSVFEKIQEVKND